MELNTHTYYEVSVYKLEWYVTELYDVAMSFVATEEWRNDTQHAFCDIDGVLDDWDNGVVNDVMAEKSTMRTCRIMLNKLCADGWLPTGDYLVTVCW